MTKEELAVLRKEVKKKGWFIALTEENRWFVIPYMNDEYRLGFTGVIGRFYGYRADETVKSHAVKSFWINAVELTDSQFKALFLEETPQEPSIKDIIQEIEGKMKDKKHHADMHLVERVYWKDIQEILNQYK